MQSCQPKEKEKAAAATQRAKDANRKAAKKKGKVTAGEKAGLVLDGLLPVLHLHQCTCTCQESVLVTWNLETTGTWSLIES